MIVNRSGSTLDGKIDFFRARTLTKDDIGQDVIPSPEEALLGLTAIVKHKLKDKLTVKLMFIFEQDGASDAHNRLNILQQIFSLSLFATHSKEKWYCRKFVRSDHDLKTTWTVFF